MICFSLLKIDENNQDKILFMLWILYLYAKFYEIAFIYLGLSRRNEQLPQQLKNVIIPEYTVFCFKFRYILYQIKKQKVIMSLFSVFLCKYNAIEGRRCDHISFVTCIKKKMAYYLISNKHWEFFSVMRINNSKKLSVISFI